MNEFTPPVARNIPFFSVIFADSTFFEKKNLSLEFFRCLLPLILPFRHHSNYLKKKRKNFFENLKVHKNVYNFEKQHHTFKTNI